MSDRAIDDVALWETAPVEFARFSEAIRDISYHDQTLWVLLSDHLSALDPTTAQALYSVSTVPAELSGDLLTDNGQVAACAHAHAQENGSSKAGFLGLLYQASGRLGHHIKKCPTHQ